MAMSRAGAQANGMAAARAEARGDEEYARACFRASSVRLPTCNGVASAKRRPCSAPRSSAATGRTDPWIFEG